MNVTSSVHIPLGKLPLLFRNARFFLELVSPSNPPIEYQSPWGSGTCAWSPSSLIMWSEKLVTGSFSEELTRNEMVLNADTFFSGANAPGTIGIFPVFLTSFNRPVINHVGESFND